MGGPSVLFKRENNRLRALQKLLKSKTVLQSRSHISSHLFSYASSVTSPSLLPFQLFLLPPELLRFPAAFHALSGSCSHVVVGPFPTQHTSVLAHSARVCSSRQQRTCWLSTGRNSNGEARSTDDKFKYFRIEPNFISVLSALVVTVMNTTGLGFLEALPADPALHRAAMSDVLPAETSASRGCGQSLSQAPHSQNKGGLQHRCCDSAALEAAFYGQVSFHLLLLVISSSSTPRELYCAGDRGALEDWTREAASGEF